MFATGNIDNIADSIHEAFTKETISKLDDRFIFDKSITIEIEHTLSSADAEDIGQFKSWIDVAKWLGDKAEPIDRVLPARGQSKRIVCKFGVCLYSQEGTMAHNHIFINKIWYRQHDDGFKVYAISILDGD